MLAQVRSKPRALDHEAALHFDFERGQRRRYLVAMFERRTHACSSRACLAWKRTCVSADHVPRLTPKIVPIHETSAATSPGNRPAARVRTHGSVARPRPCREQRGFRRRSNEAFPYHRSAQRNANWLGQPSRVTRSSSAVSVGAPASAGRHAGRTTSTISMPSDAVPRCHHRDVRRAHRRAVRRWRPGSAERSQPRTSS